MTIIALSGAQGSGKTTIAEKIGYPILKFAAPLYEMHRNILETLRTRGIEVPEGKIYGELLQYLGTEFGRNQFYEDIWVDCMKNSLAMFPDANVIVDDVRFGNEFDMLKEQGAIMVRLECPEDVRKQRAAKWRDNTTHVSEIALDDRLDEFDLVLNTDKLIIEDCVLLIRHHEEQHGRKKLNGKRRGTGT